MYVHTSVVALKGQKRAPDPLRRVSPQGAGNWIYILYKLNLSPCTISPAPRWRFLQLGWSQVFLFFNDIDYEFFGHCELKPIELFPIGPNVIYWPSSEWVPLFITKTWFLLCPPQTPGRIQNMSFCISARTFQFLTPQTSWLSQPFYVVAGSCLSCLLGSVHR